MKYTKYFPEDVVGYLTLKYKFSCTMPNGRKRSKWHCVCVCGNETDVLETNLHSTNSCGCMKTEIQKRKKTDNLIGKIYNYLYVESAAPDRIGKSGRHIKRWNCRCVCGNVIQADGAELKKGTVKSCGCKRFERIKEKYSLVGQTINSIYVIERLKSAKYANSNSTYSRYRCKCLECGCEFNVFGSALRRGQLTCGCINSKGEYEIAKMLNEYGIAFEKGFSFDDLLSPYGSPVFFDFAIFDRNNNMHLIEYQGVQHYVPQSNHFGDYQREITDPLKKEYCKIHNIPLYEISYEEDIRTAINSILKKIYANFVPSSEKEKV